MTSLYDTGIYKAVEKAGGVAKLAAEIGVKRQSVYQWLNQGHTPAARAIQIEEQFGVPRETLMSQKLRAVLMGSDNAAARAGKIDYVPRAATRVQTPADSADDLV